MFKGCQRVCRRCSADLVHSDKGLEKAEMMRTGYAVSMIWFLPSVRATLETKKISGLFTAGQTNGTSGYRRPLVKLLRSQCDHKNPGKPRTHFEKRSDGYIRVMIDDLVTKNDRTLPFVNKPCGNKRSYADNADMRLTEMGASNWLGKMNVSNVRNQSISLKTRWSALTY